MTKKVLRPILPIAPAQYDQVFANQLARSLEQLIEEVRSANINFQGIPSRRWVLEGDTAERNTLGQRSRDHGPRNSHGGSVVVWT